MQHKFPKGPGCNHWRFWNLPLSDLLFVWRDLPNTFFCETLWLRFHCNALILLDWNSVFEGTTWLLWSDLYPLPSSAPEMWYLCKGGREGCSRDWLIGRRAVAGDAHLTPWLKMENKCLIWTNCRAVKWLKVSGMSPLSTFCTRTKGSVFFVRMIVLISVTANCL